MVMPTVVKVAGVEEEMPEPPRKNRIYLRFTSWTLGTSEEREIFISLDNAEKLAKEILSGVEFVREWKSCSGEGDE